MGKASSATAPVGRLHRRNEPVQARLKYRGRFTEAALCRGVSEAILEGEIEGTGKRKRKLKQRGEQEPNCLDYMVRGSPGLV